MATKSAVPVMMSDPLEDALATYAQEHKMSRSQAACEFIAAGLGYDLAAEPKTERRRTYASAEARAKATKERAKARRVLAKQRDAAIARGDSIEVIQALSQQIKEA